MNNLVQALTISGSDLYVGGHFTQTNVGASAITANRIGRFDTTSDAWFPLGSSGGNGVNDSVYSLAATASGLFAGGLFTQANCAGTSCTVSVDRFAQWSGSDWSDGQPGVSGANNNVFALAVYGGQLFVGGNFNGIGGVVANRIARWDGTDWSALGSSGGNGVSSAVLALAVSGRDLYVGGDFSQVNFGPSAITARRIARFDTVSGTWHALGSGGGNGVNGSVRALAVSGSALYVGGFFTQANVGAAITANRIARLDTAAGTWHALGSGGGNGVDDSVRALAISGSDLYVGGTFTLANVGAAITANHIAHFDTAAGTWHALGSGGNGLSSGVQALAVSGSDLYVGGFFNQANIGAAITANHIARLDTTAGTWHALGSGGGNGVSSTVLALAVSGSELYVGGFFTEANVGSAAISANRIARWSGNSWTSLGSGTDSTVWTLALIDPGYLYVGGDFRLAGNVPLSRIGRYTTRGTLDLTLSGLDCPGTCTEKFAWDQPITLTATADPASVFIGWSGGGCSGTDPCLIDFDQDTNVTAEFELITYTIGGTVLGLAPGNSVVLQNNGGDDLTVSANGSFTFAAELPDGSNYDLTVFTQPTDPNQTCLVDNADGTVTGADVDDIEVTCTTDTYVVTTTATNGSITSTPNPVIEHGQTTTVTGKADPNHYFASVSGCDGTPQINSDQSVENFSYETGPITEACTVEAVFAIRTYEVTATNVGNGSITPPSQTIDHGASAGFTLTPDPNHHLVSVTGNNCNPADQGGGSWTAPNITQACAVTATFAINTYTVTTTATNGTITSAENPVIDHGQTTTVTGQADENHYFVSASGCDGVEQTNTDQSVEDFSYETGQITEACTVEAVFARFSYAITVAEIQGEGSVDVMTPEVEHGDDAEFEVTPDGGWALASFSGNSCTPTDNGDGTWTAENITEDCVVQAVFIENTTTAVNVDRHPALIGMPVTYTITITGTASAPVDGEVEVSSDIDGVICTISSADSSSGNSATFTCQYTWTGTGSHALTATFSGSTSHDDSTDQMTQEIVADEFIFHDRFESP